MTATEHRTLYRQEPEICKEEDSSPFKNPFCPYYGECLERAVRARWPQFTCTHCNCRDLNLDMIPEAIDMEGHYRLLAKIFPAGR